MARHWTIWSVVPVALLSLGSWLPAGEAKHKPKPLTAEAENQAGGSAEKQYWIGILAAPVDPLLKTHLRIEAGALVQHVVPDSPAARAGIQENDIVLKFGDVKVAESGDLSKAVNENKDRSVKVTLLHEGREN